jgi:cysteine desulfurase
MSIYLDYNASVPIDMRVLDQMIEIYKTDIGNADSRTHDFGNNAHKIIENARKQVASLIGCNIDEVFFTSGATESNNIAIQGLQQYAEKNEKRHIITTSIEHKAILETCKVMKKRGFEVDFVNPDNSGKVNIENVLGKVRKDTLLVAVMHVNNETGIIQPVKEIGEALKDTGVMFLVDITQSCGKLVDEIRDLQYTMLTFSAHKLGGPQGIGGLILKRNKYKLPPIKPIMYGGQQEHGISPGTVPVALVAGLGKACEIAKNNYKENSIKNKKIKEAVLDIFEKSGVKYHINGDQRYCVSNTLNVCIDNVISEALMLSAKKFCGISNGSACTSQSYEPSYVLKSMGLPINRIESSIRISWGAESEIQDVKKGIKALIESAKQLIL